MKDTLLLLPPAVNVVVTGLFAGVVFRQYLQRHHHYQLYWSLALGMAFLATLAYVEMIILHPTSSGGILLFRLYYALGGTIMPAWLGLGSIALIGHKRITNISLALLSILSIIAIILVFTATIDLQKLSTIAGTPGTGTLYPGAWLIMTIVLNTAGVIAVAGIALYSGWKLFQKQASMGGIRTTNILWANVLIFMGAILDAAAGTLARALGMQSNFWLIMALGWIILFAGVLLASRRSRTPNQNAQQQDTSQTAHI